MPRVFVTVDLIPEACIEGLCLDLLLNLAPAQYGLGEAALQ